MSLSTKYNPQEVEEKWYSYWLEHRFFSSKPDPDKEPYTIVIPPPNVTGVLHMGHMLNNTIQDILIRKARMEGKEACWVPGTDHASIATEAKVVAMLKEKGIDKKDLSREDFLKYAWEWKEKYGGIILEQLKKLGASCDWDRTRFTMEEDMSAAVIKVFVDLYNKGLIYRGVRMVNWDPESLTAISDDEVIHKEVNSKLYYIKYPIVGQGGFVTIATTRPETMLGDTAVCINPNDTRYTHLKGKELLLPLTNRTIPIIEDDYVSMEFGTGCLKVTPSHDINDYSLGIKHHLPSIDIFNDNGTLNKNGEKYEGLDRFVARKKIVVDLEKAGFLEKQEEYKNNIGYSERTNAVIEPKLSMQWFLQMDELKKPALENVMNDNIQLHPPKFKNMYRSWMENIHDWCISRQLWWGHQIPAYYLPNGTFVVAESIDEALSLAQKTDPSITAADLQQEGDVLDTWFSAWLWPISVFNGIKDPDNKDIKYYYPTNDLVTAPEILFFWVARMIISGYEYRGEMPFRNVYLTGIVRDKLGRKMSKSLGNSPDPLDLISQYGADGVRTGMLFSSPAGNDLPYDEKLVEQGRNFANKIWNAFRLIKGWTVDDQLARDGNEVAIAWFDARLQQSLEILQEQFDKFKISDALLTSYKLVWDDFCAWYLEMIKPGFEQPIDARTYQATIDFMEQLMKILHPFMPFITEEIWHEIREREDKDCIIVASFPRKSSYDVRLIQEASFIFDVIGQIRNARNGKQISPKTPLSLFIKTESMEVYQKYDAVIKKLGNIHQIQFINESMRGALSFVINADELFMPIVGEVDVEKEKIEIEKEIAYIKGFLSTVNKKLSNEKFVDNAPAAVLEIERKKHSDAEAKLRALEDSLASI